MKNLFVEYIKVKDAYRQSEFDYCYYNYLKTDYFDKIYVITKEDIPIVDKRVITIPSIGDRTNYQYIFDLPQSHDPDNLNFISNSDIYFDNTIKLLDNNITNDIAIGLSRTYPEDDFYFINNFHVNGKASPGSNDVWCWRGKCKVNNANFPIGYTACDCRIMQCFVEAGYRVYNPATDISIWHKHKFRGNKIPPTVDGPYWNCPKEHHKLGDIK